MTAMVWFRNDLRLADNPALTSACNSVDWVEACFALTPGQWRQHDWSPAKVQLLRGCLESLALGLADLGIPFHILKSDAFATASSSCSGCLRTGMSTPCTLMKSTRSTSGHGTKG